MELRVEAANAFCYPVLLVTGDPRDYRFDAFIFAAVLVVEVLSESTANDRGDKIAACQCDALFAAVSGAFTCSIRRSRCRDSSQRHRAQILKETVTAMAGSVRGNERAWMLRFLAIRRAHLMNAADPSTRKAWRESVGRVDALSALERHDKWTLSVPLRWTAYGDTFILR